MVELSVIGVFAREEGDTHLLMLYPHGIQKIICLRISPAEAFAVTMVMRELSGAFVFPPDPDEQRARCPFFFGLLSHDLMARLIETLGGRLLAVELPRVDEKDFCTELVLKTSAGIARLGCRPADAIALALRCGAMIRMPKHLLTHAEELDSVLDTLSEYLRPVIEHTLASRDWSQSGGTDSGALSPEGKTAHADAGVVDSGGLSRTILNTVKKILEQQGSGENPEPILTGGTAVPDDQASTRRVPAMEIKLVSVNRENRRSEKTPGGISISVRGNSAFSRSGTASPGGEPSDDDRWTKLLRMLSPATKVPM